MAFDVKTFRTRALTSVVFVVIMLAGLLWNKWSFVLLFGTIFFGCLYEYAKLLRKIPGSNSLYLILGSVLYISIPVCAMLLLRIPDMNFESPVPDDQLKILPCGIIFSIWINDTMAYLVGSFIGKTPLSKISPKKTWEGTIGGIVLCILVISLAGYFAKLPNPFSGQNFSVRDWIMISGISAIFGTLGDLLESKLKRMAGVKDSGSLMPGHGGFLDRFDSLLIATPFIFLYIFAF